MKKILMLSIAALSLGFAAPALADHHEGKGFEKHDTNGDGVVTEAEFLEHAKARFAKMDTDGNGEISAEEAKENRAEMKEKMKEKREKWKEKREGMKEDHSGSSE